MNTSNKASVKNQHYSLSQFLNSFPELPKAPSSPELRRTQSDKSSDIHNSWRQQDPRSPKPAGHTRSPPAWRSNYEPQHAVKPWSDSDVITAFEKRPPQKDDKCTQTSNVERETECSKLRVKYAHLIMELHSRDKLDQESEMALVDYFFTQLSLTKEEQSILTMDEEDQVEILLRIAEEHPFDPQKFLNVSSAKSWLHQMIEEELGPDVPYLITGPDVWNRLDFGSTTVFVWHIIYTNTVEHDVFQKGLRFRKVDFELPSCPSREWFVVDMCNNIKSCDVTVQKFRARLRRFVVEGIFNRDLLEKFCAEFGSEATKDIFADALVPFIHQSPEFASWIRQTALANRARDSMILRDYFTTHVLYSLQLSQEVYLKGGCSLSLGYRLITRTSEDVDLRIEPCVGVSWEVSGIHNAGPKCGSSTNEETNNDDDDLSAEQSRAQFFLKLYDSIFVEDGEVTLHHTKCKTTQAVYHVAFHLPHLHPMPIIVQLEVMHKVAPVYVPCEISSRLHDYMRKEDKLNRFKKNYGFEIQCVHPLQTLYEKIHAVHQNFNKSQRFTASDGTTGLDINASRWIRHLGDAYNIIKYMITPLPSAWSIEQIQEELAKSGDFVSNLSHDHPTLNLDLLSPEQREQLEDAYTKHLKDAYFGTRVMPDIGEVCKTISDWLKCAPTEFITAKTLERRRANAAYKNNRQHNQRRTFTSSGGNLNNNNYKNNGSGYPRQFNDNTFGKGSNGVSGYTPTAPIETPDLTGTILLTSSSRIGLKRGGGHRQGTNTSTRVWSCRLVDGSGGTTKDNLFGTS